MGFHKEKEAGKNGGSMARSWAEIDLGRLRQNLLRVRGMIGEHCLLMEVVKSDAYGHGLCSCARCAEPYVDWFAVTTAGDGIRLREAGCRKPILVFGTLEDKDIETAARRRLTANFYSLEYAGHLNDFLMGSGLTLDGHLEIDTGMNRTGLKARPEKLATAVEAAKAIYALPSLRVRGIYTHFACPDALADGDRRFTILQWNLFQGVCGMLTQDGYALGIRHCLSSTGLIWHPEFQLDMVRTGMLPLGMADTAEHVRKLGLQPVMTWYAKVLDLEEIPAGESVGYDRTFVTRRKTRLAIVSAGYADGYSRLFSNRARVLIHGCSAAVCGKVCMDCMAVDVTDLPECRIGDLVVLLGEQGEKWISANELAEAMPYGVSGAVTCAIAGRVPRIYLGEVH